MYGLDVGLVFVLLFVVYCWGQRNGYKSAERYYKEYIRDKYHDTSSWLYKE